MHNLIKSGVYPNINQIRQHYLQQTGYDKLGDATIYRDIQTLQVQFRAPLEFDYNGRWKTETSHYRDMRVR